jgi:hypothetical protein
MKKTIELIKTNWKRYLVSSGITFLSAFFLMLSVQLNDLSVESLTLSVFASILFVSIRAGLKAVWEALIRGRINL